MIRLLLPVALLAFLLVPSGAAQAACGVPAAHATYETPEVQVFRKHAKLIACYRPTGKQRVVGRFFHDTGTDESSYVYGLLGGRWLHKEDSALFAESADYRMAELVDLKTGKVAKALVMNEDGVNQVAAVPGALVSASFKGVRVRFTDGRSQVLDTAPADALAVSGARVYWTTAAGTRTATLTLPAVAPSRPAPPARRIAGCSPRRGARLVLTDGRVVVTRVGDVTYACRKGRTREVGTVADVRIVSDRQVVYARPGFTGVLDVTGGARRELASTGPVAYDGWRLAAGGGGLQLWPEDATEPTRLTDEAVADVALGVTEDPKVVAYFMAADGTPQTRDVP